MVVVLLRGEEDTRVPRLQFLMHCSDMYQAAVPSPHPHSSEYRMLLATLCSWMNSVAGQQVFSKGACNLTL